MCYTKHEIAWENSKVITTNNRYGERLCLEGWHINVSNHALNRDDGAYLPRGIHASHWQVTSSLGYLRSPDEDTQTGVSKRWVLITIRLGFVIIYLSQSSERYMIDIPGCTGTNKL